MGSAKTKWAEVALWLRATKSFWPVYPELSCKQSRAVPAHQPGPHNDIYVARKESSQAADLLRFSLFRRQASTHMAILALPEASLHYVEMKQPKNYYYYYYRRERNSRKARAAQLSVEGGACILSVTTADSHKCRTRSGSRLGVGDSGRLPRSGRCCERMSSTCCSC